MIKVADCIMGSGKSQAAITFMNENPNRKYIYIAPYLDEADRIQRACPELKFATPSSGVEAFGFTKSGHATHLINQGKNIACTHTLFRMYTDDMLTAIKSQDYVLIIDEALDVMMITEYAQDDIDLLVRGGNMTKDENGVYTKTDMQYSRGRLEDIMELTKTGNLIGLTDEDGTEVQYYWCTPKDLLLSFSEVLVLTYMFRAQDMSYYLELNDIPYENIYVGKCVDGLYRFFDTPQALPEYTKRIKDLIHVYEDRREDKRYNKPFDNTYALSLARISNMKGKKRDEVKCLIRNYKEYYCYSMRHISGDEFMWGSYKVGFDRFKGPGYSSRFEPFNSKAKNTLRHKRGLAYMANVFQNPVKARRLAIAREEGYDHDGYALSTMLQWIWRSAIRDGQEIWIYVPSRRMRDLLINWMNELQEEATR